jgi:hypothetical protein
MDLLDRYLQAVKKHLPWQRQDDILAELRANLESQLEDKEAELGRPLNDGEVGAWLKELGPPIQVAGRYQPQQYLIGPLLSPIYGYVLRLVFFWAFLVYAAASAILIGVGTFSAGAVGVAIFRVPEVLFTAAAWVTLIFGSFEFAVSRYPEKFPALAGLYPERCYPNWAPAALPPVAAEASAGKKQRKLGNAIAEIVFGFIVLVWLLLLPKYSFVLLLGPGALLLKASPFQIAPVWAQIFWCLFAINIVQLFWRCFDLWRGSWRRPHPLQRIVFPALALVPIFLLLNHAVIELKSPAIDHVRVGASVVAINRAIHIGLGFSFAIVALAILWEVGRMGVDLYRERAAAPR